MSADDDMRLFDETAGVDVGQGYRLTWSIGPDGDAWPLLVDERQVEPQEVPHAPKHFRDLAPHELLGRLPEEYAQFRCGVQARSRGRACRVIVSSPGQRCKHHPEPDPAPVDDAPQAARRTARRVDEDHPTLFDGDDLGGAR